MGNDVLNLSFHLCQSYLNEQKNILHGTFLLKHVSLFTFKFIRNEMKIRTYSINNKLSLRFAEMPETEIQLKNGAT